MNKVIGLRGQLIRDEGWKNEAYPDPLSTLGRAIRNGLQNHLGLTGDPWTIGVGHTGPEVHEGLIWSDLQVETALAHDIDKHNSALKAEFPWTESLDPVRKAALQNMAFNLGIPRLSKFQHMLSALKNGNFNLAAAEAKDSAWYTQVGQRGTRIVLQILTGEWQ